MRMRTAHEHDVERFRQGDIVDELAATGKQAVVFAPSDRATDHLR